jgi:hypothetical protein
MPFNPSALAQAANAPGWDEPPPPAEYDTQLVECEIFESKAGEDMLRFKWRVISGPQRDHEWSHVQSLEPLDRDGNENPKLFFTARVLSGIGIDVTTIGSVSDLRRLLDGAEGRAYVVEVKRNGQYTNTTPLRALASVQTEMATSGYGQQLSSPAAGGGGSNAIYQGDAGAREGNGLHLPSGEVRRDLERTGESDVPSNGEEAFKHPPQQGDIDPETGEPIPF